MIQLLKVTAANYPDIQKLAHQTWPHTFGGILSPEQIAYMLDMMYSLTSLREQVEQHGHVFLLAQDNGKHLGFASFECCYKQEARTKIHKIYVLPRAQGKGVGRLLIGEIIRKAVEAGDSFITLNVNKHNPAIEFYEKLGFQKSGEECITIGNGFVMDDIIMEYAIKKGS